MELSSFLELPFYIRLSMDGMRRMTSTQYDQLDKRILSTDAIGIESIDLVAVSYTHLFPMWETRLTLATL